MKIDTSISNETSINQKLKELTDGSLGIITKFASRHGNVSGFGRIKINGFTYTNKRYNAIIADFKRLAPLHENTTIRKFEMLDAAAKLLPDKRVGKICMKHLAWTKNHVEIVKNKSGKHGYRNLAVCGSVWDCPVCSSRISEQRRKELSIATAKSDYKVLMATYTMQHHQGESLTDVLTRVLSAYRLSKSGRQYKALKKKYRIVGSIRALEITWGVNGWHPHIHELLLLEPHEYDHDGLLNELRTRWSHCVEKRGGWVNRSVGLTLKKNDEFVQDYVAKFGKLPTKNAWDLVAEITKAVVKKGKRDGLTPMMILEMVARGSEEAKKLFQEYSRAMHRKQQLVWSGGLKKLLGIGEISDEEAAEMESEAEEIEVVAKINREQWFNIMASDNRANVLLAANELSRRSFLQYLKSFDLMYLWKAQNNVTKRE